MKCHQKKTTIGNNDLCATLQAAWPGLCDAAAGFDISCFSSVPKLNLAVVEDGTPDAVESIVSHAQVCRSCWLCP